MSVPVRIVYALWIAIFVIWAIAGRLTKRTVQSADAWKSRIPLWIVLVAWVIMLQPEFSPGPWAWRFTPEGPAASYLGLAFTVLGLGFSLWARFYIGSNWDALVTLKEDHRLVRTGPYSIVRHPIYSGFMVATLGTAVAQGEIGRLVPVVLVVLAWGYKAKVEEKFLTQRFGEEYNKYRREVKGLIPLVW
jgi:protein-S-isoprenylcysteine O-methyltransferase Ste14